MKSHRLPADLIAQSKQKYALGQARLRRGHNELALLSFHGSIEDAMRSHLALHQNPAADGEWLALFEAMHEDPVTPLAYHTADPLWHMHKHYLTIAGGEAATLPPQLMADYYEVTAEFLIRHGVVVPHPEHDHTTRSSSRMPWQHRLIERWRSIHGYLALSLITLLIFLIGAFTTLALGLPQTGQTPSLPMLSNDAPAAPNHEPPPPPPESDIPTLAPGVIAMIIGESGEGIPLRAEPSLDPATPIWLYLASGSDVTVRDGPVEAEGLVWWRVHAANKEGWCPADVLQPR